MPAWTDTLHAASCTDGVDSVLHVVLGGEKTEQARSSDRYADGLFDFILIGLCIAFDIQARRTWDTKRSMFGVLICCSSAFLYECASERYPSLLELIQLCLVDLNSIYKVYIGPNF